MNKLCVTINRKWNDAEIQAYCTDAEIGVKMALDDFVKAVAVEMGNPATILTKAQLLAKLQEASAKVQAEMKFQTRHVV